MNRLFNSSRIIAIVLLLVTGINGIVAGLLFILAPDGSMMGMSTEYLSNAPFSNYLIPGITLFVINGLMNIMAALATIKKHRKFPLLIILQGILLSGWIIIQVEMVRDFNPLHTTMLSIGLCLCLLGIVLKSKFQDTPSK